MMCRKSLIRVAGGLEGITIQPIRSEFPTPSSMTSPRQCSFMPRTTKLPKKEDLDEWQDRSEKTLRKLKPKIQSLECQTQESKDYQACLTYLTAVNESRLSSTGKKDEETKRRDMYKMIQDKQTARIERRQGASTWSSPGRPKSDIEEENSNYDDVSLQHGSRIQETAVKKSRFGEKVMARLRRQK
jgi:hypothetical protein